MNSGTSFETVLALAKRCLGSFNFPVPPEDSEQARWFTIHVLPHEPALRTWLRKCFPDADNIDDIIQDAYLRLLKARDRVAIRSPKAFLFRTARNLSLDHLKSHKISRKIPFVSEEHSNVIDMATDVPDAVSRKQEIEILKAAIQSLPDRCRQVFSLREVYGLGQKEIAEKLGVSEGTVSNQLAIGFSKCTAFVNKYIKEGGL